MGIWTDELAVTLEEWYPVFGAQHLTGKNSGRRYRYGCWRGGKGDGRRWLRDHYYRCWHYQLERIYKRLGLLDEDHYVFKRDAERRQTGRTESRGKSECLVLA